MGLLSEDKNDLQWKIILLIIALIVFIVPFIQFKIINVFGYFMVYLTGRILYHIIKIREKLEEKR